MKTHSRIRRLAPAAATVVFVCALSIADAQTQRGARPVAPTTNTYAGNIAVIREAQEQAIAQAEAALERTEATRDREALTAAIEAMQKSQTALDAALKDPAKLPEALAAQQSAYQSLLRATPREFRVGQSRNRNQQQSGGGGGQANQRQLDQLEMQREENRYETERQATAAPTQRQREQLQTVDRLRELSRRQQDINERLRELQNALQAARTEQERDEIRRQLKRLQDEQRRMLADVDELRQRMERSPNASSMAEAREQLEQTRADMERAAEELERNSASQALAAGTRAQQNMQNLREEMRRQTSSEFSEQMRDLRSQAREMTRQQEEMARELESLQNANHQSLDNSAQRQALADRMDRQQSALTNLLSNMRGITEQSENVEPLLSQKLYDTLRRADQMRTGNLLEMSEQLTRQGFLPQASAAERTARTNLNEIRDGVERAAESVLGNEVDSLRFAQRELEDLARELERELNPDATNRTGRASAAGSGDTNRLANASGRSGRPGSGRPGDETNSLNNASAQSGQSGRESEQASNPGGERGDSANQENRESQSQAGANRGQPGDPSQQSADAGQRGQRGQQGSGSQQPGQQGGNGQDPNSTEQASAQTGQGGGGRGGQEPREGEQASNQQGGQGQPGGQGDGESERRQEGEGSGGGTDRDRLREFVQQLRGPGGGSGPNSGGGPIRGDSFVNWADRLRDVERVLDPPDLRNQLTTVRERVAQYRSEFRERGNTPDDSVMQEQLIMPLTAVRHWLQQEIARQQDAQSLVPLDRDPVPDNYAELVRQYYERLGSGQTATAPSSRQPAP